MVMIMAAKKWANTVGTDAVSEPDALAVEEQAEVAVDRPKHVGSQTEGEHDPEET